MRRRPGLPGAFGGAGPGGVGRGPGNRGWKRRRRRQKPSQVLLPRRILLPRDSRQWTSIGNLSSKCLTLAARALEVLRIIPVPGGAGDRLRVSRAHSDSCTVNGGRVSQKWLCCRMHYLAMFIARYRTNDRLIDRVRQSFDSSSPFLYRPIASPNPNPEPESQLLSFSLSLSLIQELPFSIGNLFPPGNCLCD